jgi:hypothetical protein
VRVSTPGRPVLHTDVQSAYAVQPPLTSHWIVQAGLVGSVPVQPHASGHMPVYVISPVAEPATPTHTALHAL